MTNEELAPVCLFVYNRLEETKRTLAALQKNYLAKESQLYIYSDGPKNEKAKLQVQKVREYLKTIKGFQTIKIIESKINKGLANLIISGVSEVLDRHGNIIVLEDDLLTSQNFLDFMNQALKFYKTEKNVFSISGFSLDLKSLKNYKKDFYWGYRASSWGWATWKDRWRNLDWEIKDYDEFISNKNMQFEFKRNRGSDMVSMLKAQMEDRIDSWAIRWCYNQFKMSSFTLFPAISKIYNIGVGEKGTHTRQKGRFGHILDDGLKREFDFEKEIRVNESIVSEVTKSHSIQARIYWKLRSFLKI